MRSASDSSKNIWLDVHALSRLAYFASEIPVIHGHTRIFMAAEFPGWEWNEIIPPLLRKGLIKAHQETPAWLELSQGLFFDPRYDAVQFSRGKKRVLMYPIERWTWLE